MTAFMGDCIRQRSVYKHLATGLTEFCALPEPAAGFKLLTRAFQVIEGATGMGKIELAEHVVGGPGEVHTVQRPVENGGSIADFMAIYGYGK